MNTMQKQKGMRRTWMPWEGKRLGRGGGGLTSNAEAVKSTSPHGFHGGKGGKHERRTQKEEQNKHKEITKRKQTRRAGVHEGMKRRGRGGGWDDETTAHHMPPPPPPFKLGPTKSTLSW
jgi:hypothetical protein